MSIFQDRVSWTIFPDCLLWATDPRTLILLIAAS
jgi:hypothetical protein